MFKQLVFFFCLALLILGGYHLYVRLAPGETKITWNIEEAAAAFNERNMEGVLAVFAVDYKDSSQSGEYEDHVIDKELLKQGLEYLAQNRLEAGTGDFLYQIRPEMRTLNIKMESEDHAMVNVRLTMRLKMGHTWSEVWGIEVTAKFRKHGSQWLISRSSIRTMMGKRPWTWD